MPDPLEEYIRKELKKELSKEILIQLIGPSLYGPGNFEVYLDANDEWALSPVKGWKPTETHGIWEFTALERMNDDVEKA